MGYSSTNKPDHETPLQFLARRLECDNLDARWRHIDGETAAEPGGQRVMYIAVEYTDKRTNAAPRVCALIVRYDTDPEPGFNFGFDYEDESEGPLFVRCPRRILEHLSPTESANANAWRAKCRLNAKLSGAWRNPQQRLFT